MTIKHLTTLALLCAITTSAAAQKSAPKPSLDTTKRHVIEQVTVTSYRSSIPLADAPTKVEIISKRTIENSVATNLTDLIALNLNAQAVNMQGTTGGVSFRGFAPTAMGTNSYTKVLVDGMPAPTLNTSALLLANTAGVEVLKGPFSSLYGSGAMGGVINLITPRSTGCIAGEASASFGSFNTLNVNAKVGGAITSALDFDLYVDVLSRGKDYKTGGHNLLSMSDYERAVMDENSYGARYDSTRLDNEAFGLRLGYKLSPDWRMDLHNDFFNIFRTLSNGGFWGNNDKEKRSAFRNSHRLTAVGDLGEHHKVKISPFFSRETSRYDTRSPFGNSTSRYSYQTLGGEVSDYITLWGQSVTVGVDNLTQRYISHRWNAAGEADAPYNPDYLNAQTGVFAQLGLSFFEGKLTGIGGVRYDNIIFKTLETPELDTKPDRRNFNTVNANVALKYKVIGDILALRASVGSAFLAPDAYKMTGEYKSAWGTYKGNKALKAEQSLSYDFGLSLSDKKQALGADASIFFTDHKNLIVSDNSQSNEGIYTYANAQSASMAGGEYMLWADFGRLFDKRYSLKLTGSYTGLFWATVDSDFGSGRRKYVTTKSANFGISYSDKRWSANISGRYMGHSLEDNFLYSFDYTTYEKIPFVTASGIVVRPSLINEMEIEIPDFMLFDLSVSYRITKKIAVSAKVANVLDENYMERDGYYMPGRNYNIGVSVKF